MKKSAITQLKEYAVFVLPTCLCMILVELIPFFNGIYYSLTDWNGVSSDFNFVGLVNYIDAFRDGGAFLSYFWVCVKFMLVVVPISNLLALVLANVLNIRMLYTRKVARVLLFMPHVLSTVVVVYLWRFMFSSCFDAIGTTLGLEFLHASWLSDKRMAFISVCIVLIWSSVGFSTMIYTAGLQAIDGSLMEAAMIDGATSVQQFLHVKLPLLMSSVTICLFLSISSALNIMELPQLLTSGGPAGATTTPALHIYNVAFQGQKYGMAMAKSILLFAFVMVITLIQTGITSRFEQQM